MTEDSVDLLSELEQPARLEIIESGLQRIAVADLRPHPLNRPATGVKREQIDTLKMLIAQNGYDGNKPLTVRPCGDRYEIIEGHHRWLAASELGFTELPCSVKDLDDIDANKQLLTSNEQTGNDPLDIGLIALDSTTPGKHKSELSLSAFARMLGKSNGFISQVKHAANVYRKFEFFSQLKNFDTTGRTQHLFEIHAAPESTWVMLAGLLQEHSWTVKDTKAAVDRVREVFNAAPDWWTDVSSVYPKAAMEPGYAKATAAALRNMVALYEKLPETATMYRAVATDEVKIINGRDHRKWTTEPYEVHPREWFVERLSGEVIPAAKAIESAYRNIQSDLQGKAQQTETWIPIRNEQEEREHQAHLLDMRRLSLRELFTPELLQGDVLRHLRGLPGQRYDLICIDPPYNMDKADWDSYGNGKAFAEWARPWLKECARVLNDSGALYLFGINRMLAHLQGELDALGLHYRNWIAWDTIQGAGGGLWVNRHESILYYSKTDSPYEDADSVKLERHEENVREYKGKEYAFKNPSNVWRFPCVDDKHPERTSHPTQKPVELIERIIKASSPVEGRVLDCFIGSGTTGVACMRQRRYCTGIDRDADYLAIAQARFAETEVGE